MSGCFIDAISAPGALKSGMLFSTILDFGILDPNRFHPGLYKISIINEKLDGRAHVDERRLAELLRGMAGSVRIGPCRECGAMCVYGGVGAGPEHVDDVGTISHVFGS